MRVADHPCIPDESVEAQRDTTFVSKSKSEAGSRPWIGLTSAPPVLQQYRTHVCGAVPGTLQTLPLNSRNSTNGMLLSAFKD